MKKNFLISKLFVLTCVMCGSASAEEQVKTGPFGVSEEVFARQGDVVLTQAEIDAAFSRIPEHIRLAYIRDGERVNQLVSSLMTNKLLAADSGEFAEDPLMVLRMKLVGEKELAEAWLRNILEDAPAGDYETLAHEYYIAHPDEYESVASVDVTHVLIGVDERTMGEALELANSVRSQIVSGEITFDQAVNEFSDDPSKRSNGGRFPNTVRGQMVKAFEDQAFSMTEPGEISEPVQTPYGYHIIRLDAVNPSQTLPFEQVKAQIVEQVRNSYLSDYRLNYLKNLTQEPIQIEQGAVETMAKRYYGDNFELAPEFPE